MKQALTYILGIGLLIAGLWGCTAQDAAIVGGVLGEAAEAGQTQRNVNSGQNDEYYDGGTDNGGHYKGQIMNGRFHGFGTYTWPDATKYVGEWSNNEREGQGTFTKPDGSKYVGEWRNDKRDGEGTMIWSDGDKYVGEWRNAKMEGHGTFTKHDGTKYVGEWRNKKRDGEGTFTNPDGSKYVGEWRNDKRDGEGIFTDSRGNSYINEWENGKFIYVTDYAEPEPALLICNNWIDADVDGITEKSELVGLGKQVFSMCDEWFTVAFWNGNYTGTVVLKSLYSNGEVLGETECTFKEAFSLCRSYISPSFNGNNPPDFMDKIKEAGPGKYKVSAHYGDKKIVKDIELVE